MTTKEIWSGWKVENLIGEGSFGKVYKITREDFGQTYVAALKVIEIPANKSEIKAIKSEGLTDESVTTYFKSMVEDIVDEFSLMSKLKGNTNIVSYEDHMVVPKKNEFGWDIYIRMELLNPLLDYIESRSITVKDVVQLGIDICSALEVCQKYNIIHRDIKPENIFVSDIGSFKLGDFGIARQLEKTMSGLSKKGTYTYMAPEVYKGMSYNSSVDLYSLGIVMYRFLNNNRSPFMPPITEQIKFSDREEANLRRFSGEKIPKPCNATDKLSAIVLKACSYNSEERYSSPGEMKAQLQNYLDIEEESVLNTRLVEQQVIVEQDKTPKIMNFFNKHDIDSLEDEPTELMENASKIHGRDLDDDERTVFMTVEENKEKSENAEVDREPKAVAQFREKDNSKKTEENRLPRGKVGIAVLGVVFIIMLAGALMLVFGKSGAEKQAQETTIEYVDIPNIIGRTISEATELLDSYGLKLNVSKEIYSDEMESGLIISLVSEKNKVSSGSTIEVVLSKGTELITVPYVSGMKQSKAKSKLKKIGFMVKVKETFSDIYEKGEVIEQSIDSGMEIKKGSIIILTVSKGQQMDTGSQYMAEFSDEVPAASPDPMPKSSQNQQTKKNSATKVITALGSYGESNALSSGKINIIRNSIASVVTGSKNNTYTNLARYMANNNKTNANSTYTELTNGTINVGQKIKSVKIDSDNQTEILSAAQTLASSLKVKAKQIGIAISSQALAVGYKITVVIVYG